MSIRPRESKMLNRVRRWRKEAYQADKVKTLPERTKEDEDLARTLNLPMSVARKSKYEI